MQPRITRIVADAVPEPCLAKIRFIRFLIRRLGSAFIGVIRGQWSVFWVVGIKSAQEEFDPTADYSDYRGCIFEPCLNYVHLNSEDWGRSWWKPVAVPFAGVVRLRVTGMGGKSARRPDPQVLQRERPGGCGEKLGRSLLTELHQPASAAASVSILFIRGKR